MIPIRSTLWFMLFTGIIVHMLCCTSLYIAITNMAKPPADQPNANETAIFVSATSAINSTFELSESSQLPADQSNANTTTFVVSATNVTNSTSAPRYSSNTIRKRGDFNWCITDVDILKSSYTWFMGPAQFVGGMLCQKYGGKVTFMISNLSIALCCLLIPFGASFGIYIVIILRVLQGAFGGLGVGNTANMLISKWVPPNERGKFSTVIAGLYFGTAFSYFLHGWVLHMFDWRTVFYVSSAIAFLWCLLWHLLIYESPQEHPNISAAELKQIEKEIGNSVSKRKLPIPWKAILTSTPIIVNTLCQFGSMWTMFTFTMYIPSYLNEIHGFAEHTMGMLSSLPFILETAFAITFGYFTDMLLHRNILSRTNTRKFATLFNTVFAGTMFAALTISGSNAIYNITLLTLAVMLNGASCSGVSPNVIDLSPNFCAILNGIQGLLTSTTGYLSPLLFALISGRSRGIEEWNTIFLVTGAINIVPGLLFVIFSQSDVQSWNYPTQMEIEKQSDEKLLKMNENGNKIIFE